VLLDGCGHQHNERPGRTADLEPAAAERRDHEAADDGGIEAAVGRDAGRDRNRHRQRQRHDRDGQARDDIGSEVVPPIALAEDGDELGCEQLDEAWRLMSHDHPVTPTLRAQAEPRPAS
jgi:hypothetical protein